MTTNVIPMFAYGAQQLRGVMIDGQPWFVARDALLCLGISPVGGTTRHMGVLDRDEKGSETFTTPGGRQKLRTISRPGLFKLIARSSKPEAKAFDRWVRHEVLPQIMDNGGYMTKDADVTAVTEAAPANAARTDLDLMKTVMSAMQAMQSRIAELEVEATEAAPKVAFVDTYVAAKGTLSFADVARVLHAGSAQQFCQLLRDNKVLSRNARGANFPYKPHLDAGRFEVKIMSFNGVARIQTRVTSAGVEWLAEQLPKFIGKQAELQARAQRLAQRHERAAAGLR